MASRVTMDAMIKRADFGLESADSAIELMNNFNISYLQSGSPIMQLMRKPDFQRETNQWSPEQLATFLASFLDSELIPAIILWKSPSFLFVIDGGHRLSALRSWIEDDYGDGPISHAFYGGGITDEQKRVAKQTRQLVEGRIGRYSTLKKVLENSDTADPRLLKRANNLFTRALTLQWVQGSSEVAETSFFKINSQGTPLDDVEEMLLKNRRKPFAIAARAILRAGTGHKYWSAFSESVQTSVEADAEALNTLLFQPEINSPLKTIDLPLGGGVSPVNALSLLVDLLQYTNLKGGLPQKIDSLENDETGTGTVEALSNALKVMQRITSTHPGSLGLHPAVYFYNHRGVHSRFLFLGTVKLFAQKISQNDKGFFQKFTEVRGKLEAALVKDKSLINQALANINSRQRIDRVAEMLEKAVNELLGGGKLTAKNILSFLGATGRILEIADTTGPAEFSDATKSAIYLRDSIKSAMKCPGCGGLVDATKSVSYDHKHPKSAGGLATVDNGQMMHPFCNTGMKGGTVPIPS